MLDIKLIRERPDIAREDLKKRGLPEKMHLLESLLEKDKEYRLLLGETDNLRHRRNLKTEEIRKRKLEGEDISKHREEVREDLEKLKKLEETAEELKNQIDSILYQLPNILHESVPKGKDDSENEEVKVWGKAHKFHFKPLGHEEIGIKLGILDIERASKISGARFFFLKNEGVLLDLALQRLALDILREKGYSLYLPPFLMKRGPYEGVVDLKDFDDVMYKTDDDLYLIATSEHPLVAQFQNETLEEDSLPIRLAGISTCFRKEAGSHGKDTKGIFRVHQFNKIEQIIISTPDSWNLHEELLKNTEHIFQKLELPYRVVNVCTGDIGSIAAKKYDLEVWMPVQEKYREAASCSNCTDYQARRLKIRYGKKGSAPSGFVHTLNNTALATSRTIVAILENFQHEDRSLTIPQALRPYMSGIKKLEMKN